MAFYLHAETYAEYVQNILGMSECHRFVAIFDVFVTVHRWYNNIDNQLDAIIGVY